MPADWPEDAEATVTAKEEVMMWFEKSREHVTKAVEGLMTADLTSTLEVFGDEMSHYQALMIIAGHSHEHLGQSIAYARSNGIAPPWSSSEQ